MTEKPIYRIRTIETGAPHIGDEFAVSHYRPEGAIGPETRGQVVYLPGEGLEVSIRCRETNPRAVCTNPNDPVHTDSCLEAYLDCFPDLPDHGYLALEMNANGACHCSIGTGRHAWRYVLDLGFAHPIVQIDHIDQVDGGWWRATCLLRQDMLEGLYGRDCSFPPGHRMRGNFYKCGELTESPHWGSWSPVSRVDFHVPDEFGDLIIADRPSER